MENASKALIIAGAILLAIVLITLGVVIIGRGQSAVEDASIDDQVISTWNQKFTQYEGEDVSGSTVNILINAVLSANATNNANGQTSKLIQLIPAGTKNKIVVSPTSGATQQVTTKAKPAAKYSVKTQIDTTTGYVTKIQIEGK